MSTSFSDDLRGSSPRTAEIFICHAPQSHQTAVELWTAIDALGARPWARPVDLLPGDAWDTVVPASLARASLVAVITDEHWTDVDWQTLETLARAIDSAEGGRVRLVPIIVGAVAEDKLPFGLRRIEPLRVGRSEWRDAARRLVALLGDGRDVEVWLDALYALFDAGQIAQGEREQITHYVGDPGGLGDRRAFCRRLAQPDSRLRWWPTRAAMCDLRLDEPPIARRQQIITALRLGLPLEHHFGGLRFVLIPPGRTASGMSDEPVYLAERPLDVHALAQLRHSVCDVRAHRPRAAGEPIRGRRRSTSADGLSFDEVIGTLKHSAAGGALALPPPQLMKYAAETRLVAWVQGQLWMCESGKGPPRYSLLARQPPRGPHHWTTYDAASTGTRDARYRIQPVYRPGRSSQ